MDDDRIELAVVGAGPCGLAILSRLSRDCTSTGTHELGPESAAAILRATVVIDPAGGWLAAWRRKLGSQGVAQLRSPAFVHPHPSRVIDEALLRWAGAHGRRAELDAIAAADVADVPRDRPWHTPSAGAFDGFCAGLLAEHGGPVRMITPRLYAWKGAKWIRKVEFLTEEQLGFWELRGYSNRARPWANDRFSG